VRQPASPTPFVAEEPIRDESISVTPAARRRHWPHLVLLVAGLICAFHPTFFSAFRRVQTDVGDTRLNNLIVEYSYRWITGTLGFAERSFWNQPFFYPARNVAAYTDLLLSSAPIYWLFRAARLAPDTSFQLWMIAILALNFVTMSLFLRNCLRFGDFASALGGFLFAFGSPRVAQLGHQALLPQFFTVLALYGLFRFFSPQRVTPRQGIFMFFLCSVAQLWSGFYLGWELFFGILAMSLWALGRRQYREVLLRRVREYRAEILIAGVACGVLIAPLAYHYLVALRDVGPRRFADFVGMVPPPQSWFYLGGESWLYSWQQNLGVFNHIPFAHEQRLGIGWVTLVLAVWGLYLFAKARDAWVNLMCVASITIVLSMTLYPGGFTPWKYLFHVVPGGNAVRAVSRIGFLMLVPLSIGLAYLLDTRKLVVAVLIALVCIVEQGQTTPAYDKMQLRVDVARLAGRVNNTCKAFYYSPPYDLARDAPPQYKLHIDAMWAAMETGIPTVNGYSGNFAAGWWDLWDNRLINESDVARIRGAIAQWSARYGVDQGSVCWLRRG